MRLLADAELISAYASRHSEEAFATLVERYVSLVYSSALRQVRDPHLAEEITQAVFIVLARKAGSLGKTAVLAGWLCRTARFTACNALKAEQRRQHHEQEAGMESLLTEPAPDVWPQIAPLLDEALAQLGPADRDAVVLRYYQQKPLEEVGRLLGLKANTAQKRIRRALDKLRKFFLKRGVVLSAGAIAGAVSAHSVQAAPTGLAATVTATVAQGTLISATITTLVKGTMKTMTWMKLKFAAGAGVAVLLAGGAATVAISQSGGGDPMTPQQIARQAQDAYAALSSYSETATVVAAGVGPTTTTTCNLRLQRPNQYRIDWTSTGGLYTGQGIAWSDGSGDFLVSGAAGQAANPPPEKMPNMESALRPAAAVTGMPASTIPATFFKLKPNDALAVAASGRYPMKKERDEQIDGVDCYVISSVIDPAKLPSPGKTPENSERSGLKTTMVCIGKRDHLIHQVRQSIEGVFFTMQHVTDANLTTLLKRQNKPVTPEAMAALRNELAAEVKQAQGGKVVFTQTHQNIKVNQPFSAAEFTR